MAGLNRIGGRVIVKKMRNGKHCLEIVEEI